MALLTRLVVKYEARNKKAREDHDIARGHYDAEAIINIHIRCIAFKGIFKAHFDSSVNKALITGIRDAFVEGCIYALLPVAFFYLLG